MLLPRNLTNWAKELVDLVCSCMMSDHLLVALIPLRVNVYVAVDCFDIFQFQNTRSQE